jgi:hypothetical protein
MLKFRLLLLSLTAPALFAVATLASAEDKPAAAKSAEDGFVSLFNGKDLKGWKASEKIEWKVEDGLIITPPIRSHLFTDKEFRNFELRLEIFTTKGSNSGVYFCTKPEDTWPSQGYEAQVNQTHGDPVKSGSLYNVKKIFESAAKDDEWYTYTIRVEGKKISIKVNDKVVNEYTEPENPTHPQRLQKGSIALQAHDPKSVVKYRNIRIKSLD